MKNSASNSTTSTYIENLSQLPSMGRLLELTAAIELRDKYGRDRLKNALDKQLGKLRQELKNGDFELPAGLPVDDFILAEATKTLTKFNQFQITAAINASGIVLHTALGRSVWPQEVTQSICEDLRGYVTLAADRRSGTRSERDNRLEAILTEVTGAEAAAVVNNNAGATLLVLAALAAGRQTIISRGQLIEIGGAFRLPDVMAAAATTMVEVGTTNRTHAKDYKNAINENTAALLRVHPSNFRVMGFSKEVSTAELVEIAREADRSRDENSDEVIVIDDLGAGALVDMENFNLPHEPTVGQSLASGADICLFSGDKLIGASQAGIIVGRADLIAKIRRHPLHRALRADKTCLMALERTLELFARNDIELLKARHPLYNMLSLDLQTLTERGNELIAQIKNSCPPSLQCKLVDTQDYSGGGAMPTESIRSKAVRVHCDNITAAELAERLRMHRSCVFSRVADGAVWLHLRTIFPRQLAAVAEALADITRDQDIRQ